MRGVLAILPVLLLTGCAIKPPITAEEQVQVLEVTEWSAPARPPHWVMEGRAGLEAGGEAGSASLQWSQSAARYQLTMQGTLGIGSLDLRRDNDEVVLRTGDGETYVARDARELLQAVTGMDWPVEILRFWITGHAAPWLSGQVRINTSGQLVELRQNGWIVQYGRYQAVDGYQLPGRIWAEGEGSKVRLVVRSWTIEQ